MTEGPDAEKEKEAVVLLVGFAGELENAIVGAVVVICQVKLEVAEALPALSIERTENV